MMFPINKQDKPTQEPQNHALILIKNISAENLNNEIKIDPATGTFVTIIITDGVYSISELNSTIKTKINALGYDANNFSIIGDFNILKVLLNLMR